MRGFFIFYALLPVIGSPDLKVCHEKKQLCNPDQGIRDSSDKNFRALITLSRKSRPMMKGAFYEE
jgi:hypothetical protein